MKGFEKPTVFFYSIILWSVTDILINVIMINSDNREFKKP